MPNRPLSGLPPKERTIIPPEGGWEERTYYVVEVAYRTSNLIHRAIFYTGFLNGNKERTEPGGYNDIWCGSYEVGQRPFRSAHYLKAISKIEGI